MDHSGRALRNRKAVSAERIGVIVLGMHRSGTSALTRILNLLGCRAPKTLLAANEGNEKGYWESQPVMELNRDILNSGGAEWSDWQAFNPNWYRSVAVRRFRQAAARVIEDEFGDADMFVLKDPRICMLTQFWLDVFAENAIQPIAIHTLRNPIEVSASIGLRHQLLPSQTTLLWLRYMLEAERGTRGVKRFFTDYNSLMTDPHAFVERSQKTLDICWPRHSRRVHAEIGEFLTDDLRHHSQPNDGLKRLPVASEWVAQTYDILRKWSLHGEDPADHAALDEIDERFTKASSSFVDLIEESVRMNEQVNKQLKQIKDIEAQRNVENTEREALRAKVFALNAEIQKLQKDRDGMRAQKEELEKRLAAQAKPAA